MHRFRVRRSKTNAANPTAQRTAETTSDAPAAPSMGEAAIQRATRPQPRAAAAQRSALSWRIALRGKDPVGCGSAGAAPG